MKKSYIFFLISTILFSSCTSVNQEKVTIIKDCALYKNDKKTEESLDIYFFNETDDVPYVDITHSIYPLTEKYVLQVVDSSNGIITYEKETMINIDFNNGLIKYNNYDFLIDTLAFKNNDNLLDFARITTINLEKIEEESKFVKGKEYSVNIKDFGFNFVKYNDEYFLPIDLLSLICFEPYSYYYEDKAIYRLPVESEELKKTVKFDHVFSKSYYEHCFNIYMLNQEIMNGLKGVTRKRLSDNKEFTYFKNGVLNTLLPYKEKIVNSNNITEFDKYMMEMMAKELDSGGHDNCDGVSFNDKQKIIYASEYDATDYTGADVKKEREKSNDAADFEKYIYAYDTDNDGKKDIGYVTFDQFNVIGCFDEKERLIPGLFELLTADDSANALFNPRSNFYDPTKYDIKDIVIDLSANVGGSINVGQALISWICGGKYQASFKAANTGSYNRVSYKEDINMDTEFDEKDYLPDDINIYILTSHGSYSCANLVAFNCYCYNKNVNPKNKIRFMGQRPGGGCCCCTGPFYLATGLSFYQSHGVTLGDYANPNITSEIELTIDKGLELTLSQMVDRTGPNGINNLIRSKR